ncbi:MAG: filamentous hemagglutinin N-terminal domain-containing protein [Cyanobacteria bacterium P01_F01_bin.143]
MKILDSLIFGLLFANALTFSATAQITVDGTTNTSLISGENRIQIDDGDRAGNNLFHSFGEFSVPTGNEAFFNNASDIVNVFSRVTGGNISNIDGLLSVNGGANLFLLNPAGIIFGENASLNIGGSFYGTSADSIVFPEGEFSATDLANPPLITINAPLGLGFRDNPGDIVHQSVANGVGFFVLEGESISLIGGNVNIQNGIIIAPGGRIELGGLIEDGTITFNDDGSLAFPDDIARGNVSITNSPFITVFALSDNANSGDINVTTNSLTLNNTNFSASNSGSGNAGNVSINAHDAVSLTNGSIIFVPGSNGGSITIDANSLEIASQSNLFAGINVDSGSPDAQAGDIVINLAEDILIDGSDNIIGQTSIQNVNFGTGNAGNISITARNVDFINGGNISNFNNGQGNLGSVTITASGDVNFDDIQGSSRSGINNFVSEEGTGNIGAIEITANNLTVNNGAFIQSAVEGNANSGDINLNVTNNILINGISNDAILVDQQLNNRRSSIDVSGNGNSGNINITTGSLSVNNGGAITSNVLLQGNAGSIEINATDSVSITGFVEGLIQGETSTFQSNISARTLSNAIANAGNIEINATDFSLANQGNLNNSSVGQGNAGDITINATNTFIADTDSLIISNIGSNAEDIAIGQVGNIAITARDISLLGASQIQAGASSGATAEGTGTISLTATESISFTGNGTGVLGSNDLDSFGNASVTQLSAPIITIQDGAGLTSSNAGQGDAGNTMITTNNFVIDDGVITSTNLGQGNAGSIVITTDNFVINDGVISSTNLGQGNAGSISIRAGDKVNADNRSIISSNVGAPNLATTIGNVGNIEITAREISFDNTAQIQAGAFSGATVEEAGSVSLIATESISFTGRNTGIFTNNDSGSFGNASDIQISAKTISLNNLAVISASNNAAGSSNGGNIILNVTEDITLRDNSFISARALEDSNGGNLDIDARFIIAFPSQGSGNDIIATADRGSGGEIEINARQIFNLQEANAIDEEGNFFSNNSNDIDASSQAEGLDGVVAISTPDIDPVRGATELPTNPVSAETIANNVCSANDNSAQQNSFVVKGKGGVPPAPTAIIPDESLVIDGELINPDSIPVTIKPFATAQGNIYPARGIMKTADGQIILTAYPTDTKNTRTPNDLLGCS